MLSKILKALQENDAIIFDAANEKVIRIVSTMLVKNGFSPLPKQYAKLLAFTDGFVWNGVEFYGTKTNKRIGKGYSVPSIVDANLEFKDIDALKSKVVLGSASEELFAFDVDSRKYVLIDRFDMSNFVEYSTLSSVLTPYVEDIL